jgi:hypothetical protein
MVGGSRSSAAHMKKRTSSSLSAIRPTRVRYIKLGGGGSWEKDCVDRNVIRIGFGTGKADRFSMCQRGRWGDLSKSFIAQGKNSGIANRFANELQLFFEDDGSTLWVTFVGERLYWGFVDQSRPAKSPDGDGVFRCIRDEWRWKDIHDEPLTKDRLSGALTKITGFRGTSCDVDVSDYVIRRINGDKTPEVERALVASAAMKAASLGLMKLLGPRDFELLVDLVFTTSGWRRVGVLGKTQKTLDLDLVLPSTGERAFVQVKCETTSHELAKYVARIDDGPYAKMFYVFHSGTAKTDDARVTVIGPEQLADLVLDAGLVGWLIRKVS